MENIETTDIGKDDLSQWKASICAGNDCFDNHQNISSMAHYQKAICHAKALLNNSQDTRAAVAAMVISYHNLADLYLREGEQLLAEKTLRNVHQILSYELNQQSASSSKVEGLLWGLSRTYEALIAHLQKQPQNVKSIPPCIPKLFENNFKRNLN